MKLSPARFCLPRSSAPFPLALSHNASFSSRHALFLSIPLHPYCQCNPRHSAELSLFASTFSESRNCQLPRLSRIPQKRPPPYFRFPLEHHLSPSSLLPTPRNGYNSAEHLSLLAFHFSPFFRFAPSVALHREQFVPPFEPSAWLASNSIQRPRGYTVTLQARRVIIFSGPSRYINKEVLRGTRIISYFT